MATACCATCAMSLLGCCANEVSAACAGILGRERVTKIYYVFLDILVVIPAVFLFYYLQNWTSFRVTFGYWVHCPEAAGGELNCFGISAVYRLSLSLLVLYFILALIMLCRNRVSAVINEGLFLVKYTLVIGLFIAFLYVNNGFFLGYGAVCKVIGFLFLILQAIMLIDLLYIWGIRWIKLYQQGQSFYGTLLIISTVLMFVGALVLNIFGYIRFGYCTNQVNVLTSIVLLLIPAVQLLSFNEQNSLLTTSAVCLYISYLSLMGQYSEQRCEALTTAPMVTDLVVSILLFFATMYGTVMGGVDEEQQKPEARLGEFIRPPAENRISQHNRLVVDDYPLPEDEYRGYFGWKWVKWHIYMAVGSIYIAMMITNWGSPSITLSIFHSYKPNNFAFWSKIGLEWLTALLYIWTLVAPGIFPQRNFIVQ